MKKIIVLIKNVYGNEMIYPICENALTFCSLTNKKTLSRKDIDNIKKLGFEVEVQTQKL